tara:strand:- start:114 stop:377 length:264 start_codon:yes stop_codon:yes gene_type:complete
MKVKIMQRSVYHKYAEIEVEAPNDIKEEDMVDYLFMTENEWTDKIDEKLSQAEYEFGMGMYTSDGWTGTEEESEWRFQCPNGFGGHL